MRIFIIILTLVMTFKPVLPLVDYAVNYDYIAEVLCINKDKPELQCNGKCHLKSELAKANEDSSTPDSNENTHTKRLLQVEFLEQYHSTISFNSEGHYNKVKTPTKHQNYNYLFSPSIFHPPLA